jgi:hypothetical protein
MGGRERASLHVSSAEYGGKAFEERQAFSTARQRHKSSRKHGDKQEPCFKGKAGGGKGGSPDRGALKAHPMQV